MSDTIPDILGLDYITFLSESQGARREVIVRFSEIS